MKGMFVLMMADTLHCKWHFTFSK